MKSLRETTKQCVFQIPLTLGSFRVRSTNGLRVTPPISMKFGTLADNAQKKFCENFQRCRSSGFRDMTFRKMEKGSFFATRPVNQMSITFFSITGRKLHDGSF